MKYTKTLQALTLLALAASPLALAAQDAGAQEAPAQTTDAQVIEEQLPSYPLDTCVISGKPLGEMGEPENIVVDGRLVRLCCGGCEKKVRANPGDAIAKIDAAVIEQQKPHWPMESCPVSGEPYGGEMGEPIDMVHGTRYVKLCCKGCIKSFKKEPARFMARIDQAYIEQQREHYPLETCVISGEPLGSMGEPVDRLYGTTLVRLCCKGCIKKFEQDPQPHVARIRAAWAKMHEEQPHGEQHGGDHGKGHGEQHGG